MSNAATSPHFTVVVPFQGRAVLTDWRRGASCVDDPGLCCQTPAGNPPATTLQCFSPVGKVRAAKMGFAGQSQFLTGPARGQAPKARTISLTIHAPEVYFARPPGSMRLARPRRAPDVSLGTMPPIVLHGQHPTPKPTAPLSQSDARHHKPASITRSTCESPRCTGRAVGLGQQTEYCTPRGSGSA